MPSKETLFIGIALLALLFALLALPARAQTGPQPLPTFASTSWAGPGPYLTSTPVLHPWPPVTPTATVSPTPSPAQHFVYVPLILR